MRSSFQFKKEKRPTKMFTSTALLDTERADRRSDVDSTWLHGAHTRDPHTEFSCERMGEVRVRTRSLFQPHVSEDFSFSVCAE